MASVYERKVTVFNSMFWKGLVYNPKPTINCCPVSPVGRAPVCWAGGREFKPRPNHRPQCHGLSDLWRHRFGWARCDQNIDWGGSKSVPLHADVWSHLSVSSAIQPLAASEESWHHLFYFYLIYLFTFLNKKCLLSFFLLLTGTGFQTGHIAPLCPR